jgi:hypothetical protein
MRPSRRPGIPSLRPLVFVLLLQALVTGCSRGEDRNAPGGSTPPQKAGSGERVPASTGPAITKAGVNPPNGGTFTCWIGGSGFQVGDRVLVNGTAEIPTTFGDSGLVTFVAGADLLQGRTALGLVVVRPGTPLRSNSFDVPIPASQP